MADSIGIFDSGYGGLTVMKEIVKELPEYDYKYLGDNLRTPYGNRSFETVYHYTLDCIKWFFKNDCPLVILACNTASAKALRTIQQQDLNYFGSEKRVLGVIRPTSEVIGNYSESRHVGIFGTTGTVQSGSYLMEINKYFPDISVAQEPCPMWVPLVENNEHLYAGADYFVKQHVQKLIEKDPQIDAILLACTHYPLLQEKITQYLPAGVRLISQGSIVAESLAYYLKRHGNLAEKLSKTGNSAFYTTGDEEDFNTKASLFYGESVISHHVAL